MKKGLTFFLFFIIFSFSTKAQNPAPPFITHISIDSLSQEVHMHWINPSPQVVGYIIYKKNENGLWTPLDTINGINNTSYTTNNANAQFEIEVYSVVAFDAAQNNSLRSDYHTTILLESSYEDCSDFITLSWNRYVEMYQFVSYRLKIKEIDQNSGQIDQQYEINLNPLDSTYVFNSVHSKQYYFTIIAYNGQDSISYSNVVFQSTLSIDLPTYSYVNRVSVIGPNSIEVNAVSDSDDITSFNIYRAIDSGGFLQKRGSTDQVENKNVFIDQFTLPSKNNYFYRARPVDICGNEYNLPELSNGIDTSEVSNFILNIDQFTNDELYLNWNDYLGFISPSSLKLIKEIVDDSSVEEVSSNSNAVFNISNDAGLVCFYLICTENEENIIGRKDSVFSNKVCIPKSPKIYIPSAFTPNNDGKNDTWKPVIYGKNAVESYQFQVFNRWGTIIYRTESILDFWDGTFNGNAINSGLYYYSYSIRYAGGLLLNDKGNIHLYR